MGRRGTRRWGNILKEMSWFEAARTKGVRQHRDRRHEEVMSYVYFHHFEIHHLFFPFGSGSFGPNAHILREVLLSLWVGLLLRWSPKKWFFFSLLLWLTSSTCWSLRQTSGFPLFLNCSWKTHASISAITFSPYPFKYKPGAIACAAFLRLLCHPLSYPGGKVP